MSNTRDGAGVVRLLADAAAAFGLNLDDLQHERLLRYADLVVKWGQLTNLTGARDVTAFTREHIVDSLSIVPHVGRGSLLDVGSGAGLPGVVLAVVRPELAVTLLEPRQRRARFLTQVRIELALDNVEVRAQRIEALPLTAHYETIVSRAFASLVAYVDVAWPHLAPGGRLLAMKGEVDATDLAAAERRAGTATVSVLAVPGFRTRHLVAFSGPP
ncbi:MAG: 16S rRNA (guanine(527)-N(7))-methyltransferase RsmG [Gammaproteobacteria bacterium]|uniref:16S rRNA (guanine(527)-N(7))-methyltransferase RsmG n=1 Tax=Algiphilus sp. TaxID=1872431 RepID=UPI0032ED9234